LSHVWIISFLNVLDRVEYLPVIVIIGKWIREIN
jgi:hypothetical protein